MDGGPDRPGGARGVRLRRAPPGPAGGDRVGARRPRHARRDVDRLRASRRSTRSPGCCCPGATVVVSPLIALQRDQVDDLRERAAGGAAQINSSDPGRRARRRAGRARRGRARVRLPRPRAARQRRRARRARRRRAVAARGRRGALHLRVGPRLPARVPAARRGGRGARAPAGARPHRDRRAARARGDRRAARPARPRGARPRLRPAEHPARRPALPGRRAQAAARCASTSRPRTPPGIVYVATRRAARGARRRAVRATGCARPPTTRGMRAAERDDGPGALHGRRPRRRRGHDRVRHGRRQGRTCAGSSTPRSPSRSTPTTRRSAGPAATARPPRRCSSTAPRTSACAASSPAAARSTSPSSATVYEAVREAGGPVEPSALQTATELSQTKLSTAVARLEEAGAVEVLPDGEVAPAEDGPGRAGGDRGRGRAGGQPARARPLAGGHDARLRGDRRVPARLRPLLLRRAGRRAVRELRQLRGGPRRGGRAARRTCRSRSARASRTATGARASSSATTTTALVVLFDDVGYKTLALAVVVERELLRAALSRGYQRLPLASAGSRQRPWPGRSQSRSNWFVPSKRIVKRGARARLARRPPTSWPCRSR